MLGLRFLFTPFSSSLLVSWIAASIQLYICLCQSLVKFAAKPELDSTSWSLVLLHHPYMTDVQKSVLRSWYSKAGCVTRVTLVTLNLGTLKSVLRSWYSC